MNKNCDELLQKEKVTEIFKSNDTAMHTRLRDCMTDRYRNVFFKCVPIYNSSISSDLLLKAASDIFNESLSTVHIKVKEGSLVFDKGSVESYVYKVFKNAYLNKLAAEKTRMQYYQAKGKPADMSYDLQINYRESFSYQTASLLKKMESPCKDYLVWKYADDMSYKEIGLITGKSTDVLKTEVKRCRKKFSKLWNAINPINEKL